MAAYRKRSGCSLALIGQRVRKHELDNYAQILWRSRTTTTSHYGAEGRSQKYIYVLFRLSSGLVVKILEAITPGRVVYVKEAVSFAAGPDIRQPVVFREYPISARMRCRVVSYRTTLSFNFPSICRCDLTRVPYSRRPRSNQLGLIGLI